MDKKDTVVLAKYRLDMAKENLATAVLALENNMLKSSANRAYYTILHSLRAVLALEKKDFKKHSAIIAYFNQQYIKTKKFRNYKIDYRIFTIFIAIFQIILYDIEWDKKGD